MFVKSNSRREIYNNYLFNNKELPKGDKSERLVYLISRLFDNPKGNSAYKNIFDMSNENNFVTDNAVCVNVTSTHNLEQLSNILDLQGCSKIYIFYKKNRVTASCRFKGKTFGAKSLNIVETLNQLKQKVAYYRLHQEILIIKTS